MPQYCVGYQFSGSMTIKAESREEAESKVENMSTKKLIDNAHDFNIDYCEELDK